jgi:hypothetical protein
MRILLKYEHKCLGVTVRVLTVSSPWFTFPWTPAGALRGAALAARSYRSGRLGDALVDEPGNTIEATPLLPNCLNACCPARVVVRSAAARDDWASLFWLLRGLVDIIK